MFSTSFEHNKAGSGRKGKSGFGGVLDVERPQTDIVIQNCSFSSNNAENEGHDMYLRKVSRLRMANCVLASELTAKSHSLWTRDFVFLNVWNTSFEAGNSSADNNRNVQKQLPLEPVYSGWNKSCKITESPYASGKQNEILF